MEEVYAKTDRRLKQGMNEELTAQILIDMLSNCYLVCSINCSSPEMSEYQNNTSGRSEWGRFHENKNTYFYTFLHTHISLLISSL